MTINRSKKNLHDRNSFLDIVRIFACLLVLSRHWLSQEFNFLQMLSKEDSGQLYSYFSLIQKFFDVGFIGVDIFFVVSGVAITKSILSKDPSMFSKGALEFLSFRFFRLAPAYLIALSLSILIGRFIFPFPEYRSRASIFGSITFANYINNIPAPNGVSWTLVYEIKFYLIIFLTLIFLKFSKSLRDIGARPMLGILLLLWFIVFAFSNSQNVTEFNSKNYIYNFALEDSNFLSNFFIGSFGIYFMLGILIGLIRNRQDFYAISPFLALYFSCSIFVLNRRMNGELGTTEINVVGMIFYTLSIFILVFGQIASLFGAKMKFLKTAGKMTYSVYLLHLVVGLGFLKFLLSLGYPFLLAFFLALLLIFFISFIIVKYVEDVFAVIARESFLRKIRNLFFT